MSLPHSPAALLAGAFAVAVLLLLLYRHWAGRGGKPPRQPYQRQLPLFSAEERAFFRLLRGAVGAELEIFGKIPVEALIALKRGAGPAARAPLEGRCFDFVLCEKASLEVACAVQLCDPDEEGPGPLPKICENLGLPWVGFRAGAVYSAGEVRETLRKAMAREPVQVAEAAGRKEPRISGIDDLPL